MTRAAASTRAAPGPAARLPRPARAFPRRLALIAALAVASAPVSWAQEALARPTVGMRARVDGVAVPGPLLVARPLEPRAALVVRVLAARRTADGHVYDLDFYGLEPGRYDLSTALVREDGAPARLPPIPVEVLGVLKPGQVLPHALAADRLPRPGGYAALLGSAVALWLGCGGGIAGLAGAAALSRWISTLLFGVKPHDPGTYAVATMAVVTAALAASYVPARRAATADPMETLRSE